MQELINKLKSGEKFSNDDLISYRVFGAMGGYDQYQIITKDLTHLTFTEDVKLAELICDALNTYLE